MPAVYKGHDQASLDAEFRLDRIADVEALFARRAAAARAALGRFVCRRKLRYAPGEGRTLNFFPAEASSAPAPLQVFIHGGFWRSLDAELFSFLAAGFVPHGAALAVIDYPLIPSVRLAELVDACRDAVMWLFHNAAEHGADPDRLFVSGNSAGGHLVAELADGRWIGERGLPARLIKGACAISGLYDLTPVRLSFQNEFLGLSEDEVRRFSPLRRELVPAAPLILTVGGEETPEFLAQTQAFAAAWQARGGLAEARCEAGLDHITVVLDGLGDPAHGLNRAVRRQMGLTP